MIHIVHYLIKFKNIKKTIVFQYVIYTDIYMAGLWWVFFSQGTFDGGNYKENICHVILWMNWYDVAFPSDKSFQDVKLKLIIWIWEDNPMLKKTS